MCILRIQLTLFNANTFYQKRHYGRHELFTLSISFLRQVLFFSVINLTNPFIGDNRIKLGKCRICLMQNKGK